MKKTIEDTMEVIGFNTVKPINKNINSSLKKEIYLFFRYKMMNIVPFNPIITPLLPTWLPM